MTLAAAAGACERGLQWQQALALLRTARDASLEQRKGTERDGHHGDFPGKNVGNMCFSSKMRDNGGFNMISPRKIVDWYWILDAFWLELKVMQPFYIDFIRFDGVVHQQCCRIINMFLFEKRVCHLGGIYSYHLFRHNIHIYIYHIYIYIICI